MDTVAPFRLRNINLLHRLSRHSVPLNLSLVLAEGADPLREALWSALWHETHPTLVWQAESGDDAAFVQSVLLEGKSRAALLWLGGTAGAFGRNPDARLALLDALTAHTARRGVQSLHAEVAEGSQEQELLRQAGFAVYARQSLWRLPPDVWQMMAVPDESAESAEPRFTPFTPADARDVEVLYAQLVPALVRAIEPSPPHSQAGAGQSPIAATHIFRHQRRLAGFAHIRTGLAAAWLHLLFSLDLPLDVAALLRPLLAGAKPALHQPLFCTLRPWAEWLAAPLRAVGFEPYASQVAMVKHTVQHVRRPVLTLEPWEVQALERANVKTYERVDVQK
jgi:hypothetical protein